MKILGLESSGKSGGAALLDQGQLAALLEVSSPRPQGQRVLPSVGWILERLELTTECIDGIAVSLGPGSYTGLRVGLAAAKTLAWAHHRPLWAIPTLQALALRARLHRLNLQETLILPLLDARNQAVHAGYYQLSPATEPSPLITPPQELQPSTCEQLTAAVERLPEILHIHQLRQILPLGEGWFRYRSLLETAFTHHGIPWKAPEPTLALSSPLEIALLGWYRHQTGQTQGDPWHQIEPIYAAKGPSAW